AADGQRGLAGELLQGGATAVDRRVVEVGTELLDGVLGVLVHEDLAAEPDDRLFRLAVTVVFVAAAVQGDELTGVAGRPEDVVVEEPVAVVGGLLGDLRTADGAVPDRGRHVVERARGGGEALQWGAELALPRSEEHT